VRVILATIFLTVASYAQSGVEITMPRIGHQTGGFPFANRCAANETYQVASEPSIDWLELAPPTLEVRANSAFAVQVTVITSGKLSPGNYQGNVRVICASCAITNPPCLQPVIDLPVHLTVADVSKPGVFAPIVPPALPVPSVASIPSAPKRVPVPIITFEMPTPEHQRLVALIAFAFLMVGGLGAAVALRGLASRQTARRLVMGEGPMVESERHRVRR
jgi:hypothetical protein